MLLSLASHEITSTSPYSLSLREMDGERGAKEDGKVSTFRGNGWR
jgi:hypothetical protein